MVSLKKAEEVRAFVTQTSRQAAAEKFGITLETVRRYCRKDIRREPVAEAKDIVSGNKTLQMIAKKYSEKELKLLASGGMPMEYKHTPVHNFRGKKFKIGYFGDTHIGSVYTYYDYIKEARDEFEKAEVDIVVLTGDVTEGMSNRPGHMYECSELGFDKQKNKAIELLSQFDFCPLYMIDGNHDRWYIKSNGARIVPDICKELPHAVFLGHDEGDIVVNGNISIKLWHGEDGSSYAHSYRIQKLIESWQGGTKPHILFCGHVHKRFNMLERNIHCISTGSIQKQSKWMRSKRLPAHTGFGIADVTLNDRGVGKFTDTWYPLYV